jgi:hypothetical protein
MKKVNEFSSGLFPHCKTRKEYLHQVVELLSKIYDEVGNEAKKEFPDFNHWTITMATMHKIKVCYLLLVVNKGYGLFEHHVPENFFYECFHLDSSHKTMLKDSELTKPYDSYFLSRIKEYLQNNLQSETSDNYYNGFLYNYEMIEELIGLRQESYENSLIAETKVFFETWIKENSEDFLIFAKPKSSEFNAITYNVVSPNTITIECVDELITTQLYLFLEFYEKSLEEYTGYRIYLTINGFSVYDLRTLYSNEYPRHFKKEFCTAWLYTLAQHTKCDNF